jgi:ABC-2 type transport system ATP-binding protein
VATSSAAVVEVRDLVKDYGPFRAVDHISFRIEPGEVFALLGPNGAGKSSTIEILEGYRPATSGEVRVLGHDPASGGRELRDRIGIVLQDTGVEKALTVREVLATASVAYRRPRPVGEVIALVGLEDKADARVRSLSGGQRRRLDLALGLVGDPDLLFLDEPTTGFDPSARRGAWELIDRLRGEGRSILLTTHYMDEAQQLADRVAVIAGGRIVAEGRPDEIGGATPSTVIRFRMPVTDHPVAEMLGGVRGKIAGRNGIIEITTSTPTADVAAVTAWAVGEGLELDGFTVSRPTLEDVYLALTAEAEAAAEAPAPTGGSGRRSRGRRRR